MNNASVRTNGPISARFKKTRDITPKRLSNTERLRRADAAVAAFLELQHILADTLTARNGLHASLCAVLAQKGGEVTITPGTMKQMAEVAVGFQIIAGTEGEYTLRLVEESPEPEMLDMSEASDGVVVV